MSISRSKILFVTLSCVVYFVCGCSKAPIAELDAAKAAIQGAKDVEANIYMARNFENLENAMKTIEDDMAKEQSKFFLQRKYKRITEMLKQTTALANEIKADAPKAKADATEQVKGNLNLVKGFLEETAGDIKKGSRGKDKAVIEELKNDLKNAESIADRAAKEFAAGDIIGASKSFTEVQGLIKKITDTLKPPKAEDM